MKRHKKRHPVYYSVSNIRGSVFVQGDGTAISNNHGTIIIMGNKAVGGFGAELLRIFYNLDIKNRMKPMSVVFDMETENRGG